MRRRKKYVGRIDREASVEGRVGGREGGRETERERGMGWDGIVIGAWVECHLRDLAS